MARQSIRKSSSARTRKGLCGGIPMFMRKFTQRVGNSAPWGLVQKFKKRYPQGEVTTINTEPKGTYKYIILSLSENSPIQTKLEHKELEPENFNNVAEYVNKFDDNIKKLFNSGKLAFVVNKVNSDNIPYYIIHKNIGSKDTQQTPVMEFNVLNIKDIKDINSIRIFLYLPRITQPLPKKLVYNKANSQG
jgi:hypothetical protein